MKDGRRSSRRSPTGPVVAVVGRHAHLRPFSHSLPMSLLRAREAVMRRFRPSLRAFDLTEQQWRVLRALSTVERIEVSDLARLTCLHGPSLSRILPDLESRGLVERTIHAEDMRRGLLAISREGITLIEAVTPFSEATYQSIAERFGEDKLTALQLLLRELDAALAGDLPRGEHGLAGSRPSRARPRP